MKRFAIVFVLLMIGILLGFLLGRKSIKHTGGNETVIRDTTFITEVIHDTTTIEKPVPYESRELKDSIRALVALNIAKEHMIDSLLWETSMPPMDTIVEITLPREQKEYRDSTYRAWVSGYDPALDSIKVFNKTITTTITVREVEKKGPWGLGIQAGMGVGVHDSQVFTTPYIGIGLTYTIWNF